MTHAVEILQNVSEGAPDYAFLPQELKRQAGPAAWRGIECLLRLQITDKGIKTAWAQQYDALTLEPTSARNYEMAALSSDESFSIAEFLMGLANPTPQEVAAVHGVADWVTKAEIHGYRFGSGDFRADRASPGGRTLTAVEGAGPIWARYYQIGTNKPIFGDRDRSIHDDVNELSRERRNGYAWYNNAGIAVLAHYKTWALAQTR
jgi:PelA/Pel-15E family pectate lyase